MGFMDNVKGIAAKVGNAVESGAKSVSDNSKKIAEKSRVKKEISQLEAEISTAYISIGKKYFELNSASPAQEYKGDVDRIVSSTERLEKFRLLLSAMEDKQPCANSGSEVVRGQKFCDNCGAKVEFTEPPIIEGFNDQPAAVINVQPTVPGRTCPNCGAGLYAGQCFCEQCGTKVE